MRVAEKSSRQINLNPTEGFYPIWISVSNVKQNQTQRQLVADRTPGVKKRGPRRFSGNRIGFLTEKQFRVVSMRSSGYSQREIGTELGLSRAAVSMLESRARKQVERARQTLRMYELATKAQHEISIEIGTRLQQIPMLVLQEADRSKIHLRSNMVEILRMVKRQRSSCLNEDGRTTQKLVFSFNERGKLFLV